jgi:hypothetical protein
VRTQYAPEPITPVTPLRDRQAAFRAEARPLEHGRYGLAIVATALGVLGIAWYSYQGWVGGSGSIVEFYISLSLVFVPAGLIILSRRATSVARTGFALYMSLALQATRYVIYPSMFEYHDEIIHQWNVIQIDQTGHLFAPNVILPATPYYPGLEVTTSAIQQLTGMPIHSAGAVLLLLLRVVMTLGLIQIFQRISGSTLIATLATLLYTLNPQYVFFNSQFSYETIALPLCFFAVYVFAIRDRRRGIWGLAPTVAVVVAVAASHHLTSLALVVMLWVWYFYTRINRRPEPYLLYFAIAATLAVAGWTWVAHKEVIPYISSIAQSNLDGLSSLFGGRKFFSDSAGDQTPLWLVLLSLVSVGVSSISLLVGGWYAFRKRRSLSPAALTLATIAALYPIVPAGHLSKATGEAADRASGFAFVGLAFIVACWWYSPRVERAYLAARRRLADLPQRYRPVAGRRIPRLVGLLILVLTVSFAGGVVDGSGPTWEYGPGPYLVSADNRSVDQLALQAATWESLHLAEGSHVYTDRVNGLLAQTYGELAPMDRGSNGLQPGSLSELLLAPASIYDEQLACVGGVKYLIADQRLDSSLPHVGVYIVNGEYLDGIRTAPPPANAFTAFDSTPGAARIFDNGAIRIYDLKGLPC